MKRITLEIPKQEIEKLGAAAFEHVQNFRVLYRIKDSREIFVAICEIEFDDSRLNPLALVGNGGIEKLQLISKEGNQTYTVQVTGNPEKVWSHSVARGSTGYWLHPFEVANGIVRTTFLGNAKQIKNMLKLLDSTGLEYTVCFLGDARFSENSPLFSLTERQRKLLLKAVKLGYYDIPRRIELEDLAKTLGIAKSTLSDHLRKAERRIILELLSE